MHSCRNCTYLQGWSKAFLRRFVWLRELALDVGEPPSVFDGPVQQWKPLIDLWPPVFEAISLGSSYTRVCGRAG